MNQYANHYVNHCIKCSAEELGLPITEVEEDYFKVIADSLLAKGKVVTDCVLSLIPELIKKSGIEPLLTQIGSNNYTFVLPVGEMGEIHFSMKPDMPEKKVVLLFDSVTKRINRSQYQSYCKFIQKLSLPDMIEEIEDGAFMYTELREISFPKGMTAIPKGVCFGCFNLTNVRLPENLTTIRKDAFSFCRKLCDINLPASLATIECGAFAGCDSLPFDLKQRILEIGGPEAFGEQKDK